MHTHTMIIPASAASEVYGVASKDSYTIITELPLNLSKTGRIQEILRAFVDLQKARALAEESQNRCLTQNVYPENNENYQAFIKDCIQMTNMQQIWKQVMQDNFIISINIH